MKNTQKGCFVVLLTGLLAIAGELQAATEPTVQITKAREQRLQREVHYAGRMQPAHRVTHSVSFRGKVARSLVSEGAVVKKGQTILVLQREAESGEFMASRARANISGVLEEIKVSPGHEFSTGTVLFEILDLSKLKVKLTISDKDVGFVKTGGSAFAYPDDNQKVEGVIKRVGRVVGDQSSGLPVELEFEPSPDLFPGQFVKLQLGARSFQGITIEKRAIQQKFGQTQVFRLGPDNKVELVPIKTGPEFGKWVGVTSGLNKDDSIVVEADQELQDGIQVKVKEKPKGSRKRRR